jgi:general secretion pathway protein A
MFLDFYKLGEQPFGVTPDSRFLYLGLEHREALASLVYTARMGRGFHALIAPPGMGKTTLLFHLLEHLKPTARSAFLFQTQCNKREFLRYLMADIGLETSDDYVQMHLDLNQFLIRNAEEGKQFILVIDEAQNLSDEVLEAVRLLSDFETSRRKLMHIILTGQPQLERKLARPNLLQLRQRISLITRMKPLDGPEVRRYIDNRLRRAGRADGQLFSSEALQLIAQHSEGIPRNINNICFSALSLGFASGKKAIDAGLIEEVISSREIEKEPTPDGKQGREVPGVLLVGRPSKATAATEKSNPLAKEQNSSLGWPGWIVRATTLTAAALALTAIGFGERRSPLEAKPTQPGTILNVAPAVVADAPTAQPIASANEAPEAQQEESPIKAGRSIRIKPNDTLWHISESYFGRVNSQILNDIVRMNGTLRDPHRLQVGRKLWLPAQDQYQFSGTELSKIQANKERGKP